MFLQKKEREGDGDSEIKIEVAQSAKVVMGSFTARRKLYSAALVLGVALSLLNPSSPTSTEYECVQYPSVHKIDLTAERTSVTIKNTHVSAMDGYGSNQRCWW